MDQNATVINAGASVTPLNFRGWLRNELARQRYSGSKSGNVEAYVFVTKSFVTALGRKKLDKMISGAVSKHHWIVDTHVITTSEPVTDEDARDFIEDEALEGSPQKDDSEFGLLLMGFDRPFDPVIRLADITVEPVCVIRPIIEADVARIATDGDDYGYAEGDFAVVGLIGEQAVFSEAMKTLDDAKSFAGATYGAVQFFETRGII